MPTVSIDRRVASCAFVLAAVALSVLLVGHAGDGRVATHIVGPGAAPPAGPAAAPSQARVFGSSESAQQVADAAIGNNGEDPPLTPRVFDAPIAAYRAYAARQVTALVAQADTLTRALRRGDRAGAETAWQSADSTFARIGAAYGALGAVGDEIDGAPGGLPGGVRDPRFIGLRRIEWGLWTGASPRSLVGFAKRLHADIGALRSALATAPIDPLTYATRAHEILEDVQRDRLSADTPSDSGVRATADGLVATRVVLGTLRMVLGGRGDALTQSESWLTRLGTTLASIRRAHGGRYPPTAQLTRGEHERLDGTLGATLEALDGIPGELETKPLPRFARAP
jgi:hypothetical protein